MLRRMLMAGLAAMAGIALATVIWPGVAGVVFNVLVAELSAAIGVLAGVAVRWLRGELAWRRELRAMPPVDVAACGAAPAAPWLAELRPSA